MPRGITGRRIQARSGLLEPEDAEKREAAEQDAARTVRRSFCFFLTEDSGIPALCRRFIRLLG